MQSAQHVLESFPSRHRLGEILIEKKLITSDQLSIALHHQSETHKLLGEILVSLSFLKSMVLQEVLSEITGLPFIDLSKVVLIKQDVLLLSRKVAVQYKALVIRQNAQEIHIAMADPENIIFVDHLHDVLNTPKKLILYHADPTQLEECWAVYYEDSEPSTPFPTDSEVITLVQNSIYAAVKAGASDIHFQPEEQVGLIRNRIDGVLRQAQTIRKDLWQAISVRLKIMASLDIGEFRRPQSGRFCLNIFGKDIDFRVSFHPTIHGEAIVIRILDRSRAFLTLEEIGFSPEEAVSLKQLATMPQGVILVSGPTGAGKTTTLYALLAYMNVVEKNIVTLEQPVEYHMKGIRQTEVREASVMSFAEGVRSLLRQDPDVIFLSEIRDSETAQMAFRAAMTGHLVLATIHANSAKGVVERLEDLGVSNRLAAENVICSLAQRLIRKLCPNCRKEITVSEDKKNLLGISSSTIFMASLEGCDACHKTGYKGRVAILDILNDLKIYHHSTTQVLWTKGLQHVLSGMTSIEELERVLGGKSTVSCQN
jgi:type II secretory ATPase GspE/PulE/Tfp pilus assembly ATPase PilB-like protein